ncbi:alpha-D-ribose 1-methylphosphonate 5-phosphate C-P-lyase PhnJ [Alicyclobacillus fastidiosus]|uniref:Alpha-D-ribose 1-methylphosphonate 5-phosphate C-P-lyase PhnJ n=1 Tax=Alicyclobacillus fastidiosus TaxID=392011 RepID=A0ABV5A9W8_9BACL|nr:alpha-D-ribose 1-methylphosphonate 5-phosphate C-P-lyase PhnJ [Alicyclobacillus fastidiosus]WEH10908.1 alpha-D-ribose 1-methylphosphonate 5-phosphate C-P-lyase PhnJ [Alicyclobacillus fastidiosus]
MNKPRFQSDKYHFAFLDEASKREIRRATLKAISIPGHQVPFASREMPIGRGWGTGGLQLTLSLIGREDTVKVIDQGNDDSVNAVSIRKLIEETSGIATTTDTTKATLIQTRHRIPEEELREDQILVFQVPQPEPLRRVDAKELGTKRKHSEMDYSGIWLTLYEDIVRWGEVTIGADYPCLVHHRYLFNPSPIPRWDTPRLHQSGTLYLFGAGREKKIYAIPPFTDVTPIQFEDYPFRVESFPGASCKFCGRNDVFLNEIYDSVTGELHFQCSDISFCLKNRPTKEDVL